MPTADEFDILEKKVDLALEKLNMILSLMMSGRKSKFLPIPEQEYTLLPSFALKTVEELKDFNALLEKGGPDEKGPKPEEVQAQFVSSLLYYNLNLSAHAEISD
ncbi:hypothetical protein QAD02_005079 [Eretmocerus hayati]|uniref:Uncharacterized protein n=1 Tax=Eretmocerus hayati TaxID=131215 RepID=A0ACC2NRV9_9HYME|nr:hypothetical protein QAD02_005079 [Eretmocerus hayati]